MTVANTDAGVTGFVPFYRRLVIDQNREALVAYLTNKFGFDRAIAEMMIDQLPDLLADDFRARTSPEEHFLAERAVDAFFGFFYLGSIEDGHVPSKYVDFVWEALKVRSHTDEALCMVVAGRILHHFPWDIKGFGPADKTSLRRDGLAATRTALALLGPVDDAVWSDLALQGCNLCISDSNGGHVAQLPGSANVNAAADGVQGGEDGTDKGFCYTSSEEIPVADGLMIRLGERNLPIRELAPV
jgi:hypothetical protein